MQHWTPKRREKRESSNGKSPFPSIRKKLSSLDDVSPPNESEPHQEKQSKSCKENHVVVNVDVDKPANHVPLESNVSKSTNIKFPAKADDIIGTNDSQIEFLKNPPDNNQPAQSSEYKVAFQKPTASNPSVTQHITTNKNGKSSSFKLKSDKFVPNGTL